MTEVDASCKWCPFARVVFAINGNDAMIVANRRIDGKAMESAHCLASKCMAWKWRDETKVRGFCAMAPHGL